MISSYDGGGGNDVVLTAEALTMPEPDSAFLLGTALFVAAWYAWKKKTERLQ